MTRSDRASAESAVGASRQLVAASDGEGRDDASDIADRDEDAARPCKRARVTLAALAFVAAVSWALMQFAPARAGPLAAARLRGGVAFSGQEVVEAGPARARVHVLMMGMDGIPHPEIWKAFFQPEPEQSYSFYIHCKDEWKCKDDIDKHRLSSFARVVPTVFNAWCDDLLSPMLQLLKYALAEPSASNYAIEKFAFVSTEHLPVKSLRFISEELAKRPDESDMCIHDTSWWMPLKANSSTLAVAAFQWSVFSKTDAVKLRTRMPEPSPERPLEVPRVEGHSYADFHDIHCRDEVAIFWTLFGLAHVPRQDSGTTAANLSFPGFGTLRYPLEHGQGRCTYFGADGMPHQLADQAWHRDVQSQEMLALQQVPDASLASPATHCNPSGCEIIWNIEGLGPKAQSFLRDSDFLFARKFASAANLPNYAANVF